VTLNSSPAKATMKEIHDKRWSKRKEALMSLARGVARSHVSSTIDEEREKERGGEREERERERLRGNGVERERQEEEDIALTRSAENSSTDWMQPLA